MKIVMLIISLLLFMGCDQFRGPKGDTGANGSDGTNGKNGTSTLLSTKIYTGTPNINPYGIVCPEITGKSNQIIDVYLITNSGAKTKLNFNNTFTSHQYLISNIDNVSFYSLNTDFTSVSIALYDKAWGQCSYSIEIRTFSSASAAIAYKRKDTINYLVGTDY